MGKKYVSESLEVFSSDLSAKKTMPGGGSAAAYAATIGGDLASMVANFTLGKKKYKQYEKDVERILEVCKDIQKRVISLVDEDIEAFMPLSKAYKLPQDTEEESKIKNEEIQKNLLNTAKVPMKLLRICREIVLLHRELLDKGSVMLISDVGVGVELVRAAALSAKLNIMINIKYIEDREVVEGYKKEMDELIDEVVPECDRIFEKVERKLL